MTFVEFVELRVGPMKPWVRSLAESRGRCEKLPLEKTTAKPPFEALYWEWREMLQKGHK